MNEFCDDPRFSAARLFAMIGISCALCPLAECDDPSAGGARLPEIVDFGKHIQPILNSNCTACHGGVKQAGDVSFVYKDQVLPPNGWIVEPGDPDASILIERIEETDADVRMPPPDHGKPLSKNDIGMLRKWIRQGAKWETGHWAYSAPEHQETPDVRMQSWPWQPMDAFVLRKLEEEGLQPSEDAAADRWLRRVSLDATGMPPSLSERTRFLAEYSEDPDAARAAVVDRLLASPAYGEKWASVWLDQVRYADSRGLGADGRRNIWKYRDWVIKSYNDDMPFDQFTVRQLAGDLLPNSTISDVVATAAHRVTQTNEEGGTDDEEFRVAAVIDRVSTTWQAWHGVTFGCVQCHSHPYDPFRHEEFYQFAAFFNNTADCDLNEDWPVLKVPIDDKDVARAEVLDGRISTLNEDIWRAEAAVLAEQTNWRSVSDMRASTNNQTRVAVEEIDGISQFHTVDTISRRTDVTVDARIPDALNSISAVRLTVLPLDPATGQRDSEWGFVLSHIEAEFVLPEKTIPITFSRVISDEPEPFYDPQDSLNSESNRGFAAYTRIHHPRSAAFVLSSPVSVPEGASLRVRLKHRVEVLGSFSLMTRRAHIAVSDDSAFHNLLTDESLVQKRSKLAELRQERIGIKSVATPILKERIPSLGRPTHVFERGLFLTKAQEVSPGTPESLHPLPADQPRDRLALARWLVSDDNPLTARVTVNRIWSRLFGVGLVLTEEDFGSSGEPPSHPELLDHLARRFQFDHKWSNRKIIREILLSHTYFQTARADEASYQRDPTNRLLSRGPRFRLSSEIVRDQALVVSGLLTTKLYGPPVHPPIPSGVWKPFQAGDKWDVPQVDNPDRYRRSIYTYTKRSIPYPMFAAFDSPSREFCAPRRLRSNTPLQALMLLNDTTFVECAAGLAGRMNDVEGSLRDKIAHGMLLVTSRTASDAELDDLVALCQTQGVDATRELSSTTESDSRPDLQIVATLMLNLDEFVTK